MPNYDVYCKECGASTEIFRHISEYQDRPECCGQTMAIKLTPTNIQPDIQPYKSMLTGQMVTSRSEHRRLLLQNKCIEVGNERIEPKKAGWTTKQRDQLKHDLSQRLEAVRT